MICAPVFAQEPVVGVADPDALFHSKDKKLDKNLQSAYHIMLDLLECNQWDQSGKWLTEAYHQHNPLAASGRAGVVAFFKGRGVQPTPVPPKFVKTKIVAVLADGDYVTVQAEVAKTSVRKMNRRSGSIFEAIVTDGRGTLTLTFFGHGRQDWRQDQLNPGVRGLFSGQVSSFRGKRQLTHPEFELLSVRRGLHRSDD